MLRLFPRIDGTVNRLDWTWLVCYPFGVFGRTAEGEVCPRVGETDQTAQRIADSGGAYLRTGETAETFQRR